MDEYTERRLAEYCAMSISVKKPRAELVLGSARLVLSLFDRGREENGNVSTCFYRLLVDGIDVGSVHLSAGCTRETFLCGNIGYAVDERYRGRGYAGQALNMLVPMMRSWGMSRAAICVGRSNTASRRVCEKLGAVCICTLTTELDAVLREQCGENEICVYLWEF